MEYAFKQVESKWQQYWRQQGTYTSNAYEKPKYYVLDMFPYPSGAGLHVGHPLGYIASDIYARYKRLQGFNVLHPMGYDSFGLPAEQYAIQTGQHPAITTQQNIARYRQQLDMLGFSFDWQREIRTSEPDYYKWTQWIFIQLFNSWYDNALQKAMPIDSLIKRFETNGNSDVNATTEYANIFTASQWQQMDAKQQHDVLMAYRMAYLSNTMVNWCAALGSVLANDEVKDGVSERGGYPVERKLMQQWSLRITAYSQRLLDDLETIDWSESLKESQRNWIGRSDGTTIQFNSNQHQITVFTTRPDTIFGVTYLTLAPENILVAQLTTPEQQSEVTAYVNWAKNRSERERQADVKKISGVFTGAYAIHPFTKKPIPIWVGDYVLAGYGTGAVMAVPAHDTRDYAFARHFNLPVLQVIEPPTTHDFTTAAYDEKNGTCVKSDFLNGLSVTQAIKAAIAKIETSAIGKGQVNYRQRDAVFGRQRYWGEPIPIYYVNGIAHTLPLENLPLVLPVVDAYLPTEQGEPPLARAYNFTYNGHPIETTTMPGWAGSSWYYLRYMDANNNLEFASEKAINYWQQIDLYLGGSEHATGHLLYVRFWTKFLYDLGYLPFNEPAKKLINQGMIQGTSAIVYRAANNTFISAGLKNQHQTTPLHADVNMVVNNVLDVEAFKAWRPEYANAQFVLEEGKYICGSEVEKMSKSKYNVVTPDDIIEKYGADCLRMYEMFLGPLEQSKPWNTNGITGVSSFLKKLWRLYLQAHQGYGQANESSLKTIHKTIKKVTEDMERFSFNTSVSSFMICVNELTDAKCTNKEILQSLAIILSPYAPHIAEEAWQLLGNNQSIAHAQWPKYDESFLVENVFEYPVSINGKMKFKCPMPASYTSAQVTDEISKHPKLALLLQGVTPKKIIVVPGKIINVVV